MFCFSRRFWRDILVKFSASDTQTLENVARGKFTKISHLISRHHGQRKTEKNFTPHLCRVAALIRSKVCRISLERLLPHCGYPRIQTPHAGGTPSITQNAQPRMAAQKKQPQERLRKPPHNSRAQPTRCQSHACLKQEV